jgi:hypothetical protein
MTTVSDDVLEAKKINMNCLKTAYAILLEVHF